MVNCDSFKWTGLHVEIGIVYTKTKEYTDRFHFISFPSTVLFWGFLKNPPLSSSSHSSCSHGQGSRSLLRHRQESERHSSLLFCSQPFFFLSLSHYFSYVVSISSPFFFNCFPDLLTKDYSYDQKFTVSTYSDSGVVRYWLIFIPSPDLDFFWCSSTYFVSRRRTVDDFLWRCVTVLAVFYFFCTLGLFCWADLSWFVNVLFFELCFRVWIGEWLIGCLQRWYELEIRHYGD